MQRQSSWVLGSENELAEILTVRVTDGSGADLRGSSPAAARHVEVPELMLRSRGDDGFLLRGSVAPPTGDGVRLEANGAFLGGRPRPLPLMLGTNQATLALRRCPSNNTSVTRSGSVTGGIIQLYLLL